MVVATPVQLVAPRCAPEIKYKGAADRAETAPARAPHHEPAIKGGPAAIRGNGLFYFKIRVRRVGFTARNGVRTSRAPSQNPRRTRRSLRRRPANENRARESAPTGAAHLPATTRAAASPQKRRTSDPRTPSAAPQMAGLPPSYFFDRKKGEWREAVDSDGDTSHGNRGTVIPLAPFARVRTSDPNHASRSAGLIPRVSCSAT